MITLNNWVNLRIVFFRRTLLCLLMYTFFPRLFYSNPVLHVYEYSPFFEGRMERKYDKASARIKELEAQAANQGASSGGVSAATSVEVAAGTHLAALFLNHGIKK